MRRVLMAFGLGVVLLGVSFSDMWAQGFCQFSYTGLTKDRRVMGPVNTECHGDTSCISTPHSAPFGNWGVTSNYGHKIDGHQFDGWCRYRLWKGRSSPWTELL